MAKTWAKQLEQYNAQPVELETVDGKIVQGKVRVYKDYVAVEQRQVPSCDLPQRGGGNQEHLSSTAGCGNSSHLVARILLIRFFKGGG